MQPLFLSPLWIAMLVVTSAVAVAQNRAEVEAGAQVYEENCQACHGERLRNTGQGFDLKQLKANERDRFDKAVLNGRPNMPPWQGVLETQQIDQLWAYVRAYAYD